MAKPLKIAIVGCGVIAPAHIESFMLDGDVEVALLCDIVPSKAQELSERYKTGRAVSDPREVFADPSIDAVSICTPHYNHHSLSKEALAAGKDVIVEKPVANSREALEDLKKTIAAYPLRIFASVFQHRYNPVFSLLKKLVSDGALGRVVSAAVTHRCTRSEEYYRHDSWRGTKDLERGGVLINQAVHYLDLFQWIMGGVDRVRAFSGNLTHRGIIETEDAIVGAVRFKNGAFGTIEATSSSIQGWDTRLCITGTAGFVSVNGGHVEHMEFADESVKAEIKEAEALLSRINAGKIGQSHYGYGHPAQIADFISSVRTRKPPRVTAADALDAAQLVLEMYESCAL